MRLPFWPKPKQPIDPEATERKVFEQLKLDHQRLVELVGLHRATELTTNEPDFEACLMAEVKLLQKQLSVSRSRWRELAEARAE